MKFKEKVVFETENYKKFPRQVFEECGFDNIDPVKEVIQIRNLADSIKKYSVQIKHSIDLESFADDLFDEIMSKFVDIHKDHERFNKNELMFHLFVESKKAEKVFPKK